MATFGKSEVRAVVAFIVGGLLGLSGGGYLGFRKGFAFILNECVSKDAKEVQSMLATLGDLRAGRVDAAVETVESRLDDQLILFDPQEPYPLTATAAAAVDKALRDSAAYRSSYPRKSRRSSVDSMVADLLGRRASARSDASPR